MSRVKAETIFEAQSVVAEAIDLFAEELAEVFGEYSVESTYFDQYDCSIELEVINDFTPTTKQMQYLSDAGFDRAWIKWSDNTEEYWNLKSVVRSAGRHPCLHGTHT